MKTDVAPVCSFSSETQLNLKTFIATCSSSHSEFKVHLIRNIGKRGLLPLSEINPFHGKPGIRLGLKNFFYFSETPLLLVKIYPHIHVSF